MRRTTTSLVILADMLCKEMECVTIVTRMPETKKELLARQLVEPSHRRAILCIQGVEMPHDHPIAGLRSFSHSSDRLLAHTLHAFK